MKSTFHKKLVLKKITIAYHLYGSSAAPDGGSFLPPSSAFHIPTEVPSDFPEEDITDESQNTTLISGNQQSCM